MEIYKLKEDIKVFGIQVKTFPAGVSEAFQLLAKMTTVDRSYYGISYFSNQGEIIYKAAAEEKYDGEAKKYQCERYIIEKGEYLMVSVRDWRTKTDCIRDVFREIMKDNRISKNSQCIEWYKKGEEMLCMIKITNQPV